MYLILIHYITINNPLKLFKKHQTLNYNTAQLCRCNYCMAIMVDNNPSDQPEFEIPDNVQDMVNLQSEDESTGNLYENYWACPNCKSDAYLIDVTEVEQINETFEQYKLP